MNHDRDHIYVKGRPVRHTTAQRDWRCGTCGGRLATRFFHDVPNWRTVCTGDPDHDHDTFVHHTTWDYLQARRQMDVVKAEEVFQHLPPELQAAIQAR